MRSGRRGLVSSAIYVFFVLLVLVPPSFLYSAALGRKVSAEISAKRVPAERSVHGTRDANTANRSTFSLISTDDGSIDRDTSSFPSEGDRHLIYAGSWHHPQLSGEDISSARRELCLIRRNGHVAQDLNTDTLHLVTQSDLENCDKISRVPALQHNKYCKDALSFFDTGVEVQHMLVTFGDVTPNSSLPFITKSRPRALPPMGILWPLNVERHFAKMASVGLSDTPWEQKRPRLVWRGADTGRGERAKLVRKFISDQRKDVDIALTFVLEYGDSTLTRPALGMKDLLQNKYLLSLEGNDVSSGLKWMLLSKSVVFMPTSTYESWALESQLRPFIHYVPVQRDLSDMHERLKWAKSNDELCRNISARATEFMSNFLGYSERNHSLEDVKLKQLLVKNFNYAMSQVLGDFALESCEQNHTGTHST